MKWILISLSKLSYPALHCVSTFVFYLIYFVLRYRRTIVRENLIRSFSEKNSAEIIAIEKKFYRNFCDILIETIKNFSITEDELRDRCKLQTREVGDDLFRKGLNLAGISSHLANWECLALSLSLEFPYQSYGVYKPLTDQKLNEVVVKSRERFGIKMIPIKKVREVISGTHDRPYLIGLLSDQAPHDYSKAFVVQFLNQKTYVVPGPGILTVQNGLTPVWGWMKRVGRSRFEWGIEELKVEVSGHVWSEDEKNQIERISKAHGISESESSFALLIIQQYSRKLEAQIQMAPEDWLWSHRRWKLR